MKLLSVNLSLPKPLQLGHEIVQSSIFKVPTDGVIELGLNSFAGDEQGDKLHHGGADQAVYIYSAEDYDWWTKELGQDVPISSFGENLTFSSFGDDEVRIGDRFQVGEVVIEASAPRIPCGKLAAKMQDPQFVKKFHAAKRPGFYARVIETGKLQAGDTIERINNPDDAPTVAEIFTLFIDKNADKAALSKALKSPLAERCRAYFEDSVAK